MPKDTASAPNILNSELALKGMVWDVVRESFEYLDGELTREFVKHPGAVAVLAVNHQDEVLLINQYRHPVRSRLWEIPAGLRDIKGEDLAVTAQRELLEETGYRAQKLEPLIAFHTTPGGNDETIHVYLAESLEFVGHNIELEGEERDLETQWVPLAECVKSVLKSDMKSPSLVVAVLALWAKRSTGI